MSSNRPLLIGVTGGMGSGKSTLTAMLRKKGYKVFDCDAYTRLMTKKGSPLLAELASVFGSDILTKDGRLKRKCLAKKVFADPELTARLNSMMHGGVLQGMREFADRYSAADADNDRACTSLLFAEIPLLYEAGWEKYVDEVWLVTADEEIRKRRIKERDASITDEDVSARLARQLPDSYKKELADMVFVNDGGIAELEKQLDRALCSAPGRHSGNSKDAL